MGKHMLAWRRKSLVRLYMTYKNMWRSFEMDKELPKMVFYDMLTASLQGKKHRMRLGRNKNVLPE